MKRHPKRLRIGLQLLGVVMIAGVIAASLGWYLHSVSASNSKFTGLSFLVQLKPQPRGAQPQGAQRWSNPATWGGQVPQAGGVVTIPTGATVLLDVSPPPLQSLTVNGTLNFDRRDLTLQANSIVVMGHFSVGTSTQPFQQHAEIILTGTSSNPLNPMMGSMGTKVIGVMGGGTLDLYGTPKATSWTHLSQTVGVGGSQLVLDRTVDWPVGSQIVVASTDFPQDQPHTEQGVIKAIHSNVIDLSAPLKFQHWSGNESGVPERAEVGLLTRNIVVRGDDASATSQFGGQVIMMSTAKAHISWAQFRLVGQKGLMGHYPIHFHEQGDGTGSFVQDSTIEQSFNRCITIHGTNNVRLEGNITYQTVGHCFYMEEGDETGNVIKNNLALVVYGSSTPLVSQDDKNPVAFWITNPNNTIVGNAAAEAGSDYWYPILDKPIPFGRTGQDLSWMDKISPKFTPLGTFQGNVGHSSGQILFVELGFKSTSCDRDVSRNLCAKENNITTLSWHDTGEYNPRQGAIEKGAPVVAEYRDLIGYKSSGIAVWFRGDSMHLVNALLADNERAATFAGGTLGLGTIMQGGLIVGESANSATRISEYAGFRQYDGYGALKGVQFMNFKGTNAALNSHLPEYNLSPDFTVEGLQFTSVEQRVYIDPKTPVDLNTQQYAMVRWFDKDGSLTGQKESWVVSNDPLLHDANCQQQVAWNAYICPASTSSFMRFTINGKLPLPLSVVRQDGASMQFGVGQTGFAGGANYDVLSDSPGTTASHVFTLQFTGGTPAGLVLADIPTPFADGSIAPNTVGTYTEFAITWPSNQPFFGYTREWRFGDNTGTMTQVTSQAALDADPKGDVYYRQGDTLYVRLVESHPTADWYEARILTLCSTAHC